MSRCRQLQSCICRNIKLCWDNNWNAHCRSTQQLVTPREAGLPSSSTFSSCVFIAIGYFGLLVAVFSWSISKSPWLYPTSKSRYQLNPDRSPRTLIFDFDGIRYSIIIQVTSDYVLRCWQLVTHPSSYLETTSANQPTLTLQILDMKAGIAPGFRLLTLLNTPIKVCAYDQLD